MRHLGARFGAILALVLGAQLAGAAPGPVVERRPLIVLADAGDPNDVMRPAFLTAFALYDDGTVIRRVGRTTLRQAYLSAQSRDRFVNRLALASVAAAATQTPLLDVGGPERSVGHANVVELHTWADGKRQTMRIVGITTADLELCSTKVHCPNFALAERLAPLPEVVFSSVNAMFRHPLPSGRELCRQRACYNRDLTLPAQDAWTPS